MGLRSERCGSVEHVRNGLMSGKRRYLCKGCGLNFTDTPPRGRQLVMKVTAVLPCLSGLSDEPQGQAAGRLDAHRYGLDRALRRSPRPETRARGPRRGGRAGRDVALSEKKSDKLWVWKARDP